MTLAEFAAQLRTPRPDDPRRPLANPKHIGSALAQRLSRSTDLTDGPRLNPPIHQMPILP